jgi:protein-disulfide isomerase
VRDFPLTEHAHAFKAAEAAEAARAQNKYWEYAALLFANQAALELGQLKEYASRLGLDRTKFDTALDGGTFADNVRRDQLDGERAGVFSTPTIFVNGRRAGERTYEGLKATIEAALKAPPAP